MASESIFDFLKGGKPISLEHFQPDTAEKESNESIEQLEAENWALYTLNPEGRSCPLDCIIVHNYFKFLNSSVQIKIVKCTSCSPSGKLPILVADLTGRVLENADIITKLFDIADIKLYAAIDGLLGDYIRIVSGFKSHSVNSPTIDDVIDLIVSLNNQEYPLDSTTKALLFSMIQGAKLNLNQSDRVRQQIEKSEHLNDEIFVNLLESIKK